MRACRGTRSDHTWPDHTSREWPLSRQPGCQTSHSAYTFVHSKGDLAGQPDASRSRMPQIRVISHEEPSVQLSDLLARLTPDERATVIERRLGPNAVPLDNRALANQLGNVREVGAALAQLN